MVICYGGHRKLTQGPRRSGMPQLKSVDEEAFASREKRDDVPARRNGL